MTALALAEATPPATPAPFREAILRAQNNTLIEALQLIGDEVEAHRDQIPSSVVEMARLVRTYADVAGKAQP